MARRMGGYPRLWWRDGTHLDLTEIVPDQEAAAFVKRWQGYHVRVEWLLSPHGRLDLVLPQTLERIVHNANVRSGIERKQT